MRAVSEPAQRVLVPEETDAAIPRPTTFPQNAEPDARTLERRRYPRWLEGMRHALQDVEQDPERS